jgi:hypothetical protein
MHGDLRSWDVVTTLRNDAVPCRPPSGDLAGDPDDVASSW